MIFATIVHKTVEKIMADANETKARIQEIRSRVFQEPSKENLTSDITDVTPEPVLDTKKLEKLTLKEIKPDFIKKEDSIKKEGFIKKEDFVNFKNQLNNDIKDYFSSLDEKLTKTLNSFETKIPDIKKGSKVREELDSEIGDIISQRMIQQSRTLNRAIEDLSGGFATTNDLGEMKKGLEGALERETGIKLENIFVENKKELDLGLGENLDKLEEFNSSIREDFSSLMEDFMSSKNEIDTKFRQNDDKITLLSAGVGNKEAFERETNIKLENISAENKKELDLGLVENLDKLEEFNSSIRADFSSFMEDFTASKTEINTKFKQNDDKITLLNADVGNKIAKIALSFANKSSALEEALFHKVEYYFEENTSKLNQLEGILTDSIITSSKAFDGLKQDLEIRLEGSLDKLEGLNGSIRDEFSSLLQKVKYSSEKSSSKFKELEVFVTDSITSSSKASVAIKNDLEIGLAEGLDKLEEFNIFIREDFNSFTGGFTSSIEEIYVKLKQNDEKITLLGSDVRNKIAKIILDFSNKNSLLEESLSLKVEYGVEENISKLNKFKSIITNSMISSFKASDAIKKDLELGLKCNLDKLEEFNSSIRKDFTSSNDAIDIKLKQKDEKITLLSIDTQNLISKTTFDFQRESSALEESFLQKVTDISEKNVSKFKELEGIITDSIITSFKASDAVKKDLEVGFKDSLDKLEEFNSSIREDFGTLSSSFTSSNDAINITLKQKDEKITLLNSNMQNLISKTALDFEKKNRVLETSVLQKFDDLGKKNIIKFNKLECVLADNLKRSSKATDAVKHDLECGLVESLDKLQEFNSSIRKDLSTLVSSFTSSNDEIDTKLKQKDEKITLLNSNMQNLISKTTLDFEEKNRAIETSLLQKFDDLGKINITKFNNLDSALADNLKRSSKATDAVKQDLESGLVESLDKLQEFNSSIRKDLSVLISSFSSSNNEIDKKLKQNDEKIILLGSDIRNKIAKLTLEFKNKNISLGDSALKQTEKVSGRLSIVEAEIKNNMGEIRSVIKENLELSNDVTGHVDGLRQSIELLESMIVREDDLTALFQNYTLNLNINRDKNFEHTASSKRIEAQAGSNVIDM